MTDSTTDKSHRAAEVAARSPLGGGDATLPRCLKCDYILVGLPGDRCPECGTQIDWDAVRAATRDERLPIERERGWRRGWGAVRTWALVVGRPRRTAQRISEQTSTLWATVFALGCMVVGIGGNAILGQTDLAIALGWAAGVWFHIECQSVLFLLLDGVERSWWRRWMMWRNVSLLTTAFVVLDMFAGPPLIGDYLTSANFPWPLDADMWQKSTWWPVQSIDGVELLRGVVYYWWMVVLATIVWVRLRRKWVLLLVVAVLPWITLMSCQVGVSVADLAGAHI